MPCWETRTITVGLKNADASLLAEALRTLGYTVETKYGQLVGTRNQETVVYDLTAGALSYVASYDTDWQAAVNEVKRQYARQAVQTAARRYGWTTRQVSASQPNKLQMRRGV